MAVRIIKNDVEKKCTLTPIMSIPVGRLVKLMDNGDKEHIALKTYGNVISLLNPSNTWSININLIEILPEDTIVEYCFNEKF